MQTQKDANTGEVLGSVVVCPECHSRFTDISEMDVKWMKALDGWMVESVVCPECMNDEFQFTEEC